MIVLPKNDVNNAPVQEAIICWIGVMLPTAELVKLSSPSFSSILCREYTKHQIPEKQIQDSIAICSLDLPVGNRNGAMSNYKHDVPAESCLGK